MSSVFGNFSRLVIFCILFSNIPFTFSRVNRRSSRNLPKCKYDEELIKSDKLLQYISQADFIFTGRVTSVVQISNNSIVFEVFVQRCFKNSEYFRNDSHVKVVKGLRIGEGHTCRQVVRKKFTAIFVGQADANFKGDVELLIDPVPVTLSNLDRVSEATKGHKCHHNESKRAIYENF